MVGRADIRRMTTTHPTIAILGAGNVGRALGATFGRAGYAVRFGVREGSDARAAVDAAGPHAAATSVADAVKQADVIFVSLPTAVAVDVLRQAGDLDRKIIVDCTNPVRWQSTGSPGPLYAPPPEGSIAAAIQQALPQARVVKGWNTFGAEIHANPRLAGGLAADVLLAGDDAAAKATLSEIARSAGFVPVDAGPLRNAALLESAALLWIHLALVGGQGRTWTFNRVGQ
jgi:8-hydroxy-5-deazaflavin:NADPH oxidoreductase